MREALQRVTMKDLAARAGVSVSTAHLVMAGKPGPKEETRREVLRVAKELNYQPNTVASALKRGVIRVAVVLPAQEGRNQLYYGPIWDGVREYCKNAWNYNVQLEEMPYSNAVSVTVPLESVEALEDAQGLSGALILGDIAPNACRGLRRMSARGFPIVLVNGDVPETGRICCVQAENYILGRMAGELLMRITPTGSDLLVCAGEPETPANAASVRGFEEYIRQRSPERKIEKLYYGYGENELGRLHGELMSALQERRGIQGCFSATAQGSIQLAKALRESGLLGKVSAVGSDVFPANIEALKDNVFQYLMYKNPYYQGWRGMEQLLHHIFHMRLEEEQVRIKCEVILQSAAAMYNIEGC